MAAERLPVERAFSRREVFLKMPAGESRGHVEEAREDADPGRLEMQVASPAGGPSEHEGQRQIEERWSPYAAGFAPIEARVRQDDAETADQECDEADGVG